jgi:hypothetical protein
MEKLLTFTRAVAITWRERILNSITEYWAVFALFVILAALGISFFLATAFAGTIKLAGTIFALIVFALLMKFPEAFSSIGGTDVEMPLAVILSATQGVWTALGFVFVVSLVGSRLINERPQYTLISLVIFSAAVFLVQFIPVSSANIVLVATLFIIVGFFIGAPFYISMGNPIQTLLLYCFVNIVWNYVFLTNFSQYFLPSLGGL